MRNKCSTCLLENKNWFEALFLKDCSVCRVQWKAFYSGATQISPIARAIMVEQQNRSSMAE